MKHLIYTLCAVFLLSSPALAEGALYRLDPDQTNVRFATKMCEADLLIGDFQDIQGEFYFDEAQPEQSYVHVTIAAKDTLYNKTMHKEDTIKDIIDSEKILKVQQYPIVTFKSTKVVKTSDITADVTGDMTLVGMTYPFTMEVTFHDDVGMTTQGRKVASFSAYGTFKRSDFGVLYGLDRIGIRKMGNEVMVFINAAGIREDHKETVE